MLKILLNKRAAFLVIILPLLQGCLFGEERSHEQALGNYDQAALKHWLVPGKTTKKDVLTRLGPPKEPSNFSLAFTWHYSWNEKTSTLLFPIPIVMNRGTQRTLDLRFADNNTLSSFTVNEGKP
ncbi:Uncharacterised protein [Yersinia frederiksenii]|nr:hypothetical protein B4901_08030 [Yersinia frederiksenii]CND35546.1 Uncharacterised protein [Yersinia frederiksenii]CNI80243.1 Uncharacterised protein [Yersinia frederiksenii]CNJ85734.1 Uncharacterised protein [Yersinia frederiksenii]CNL49244.1 Uncharacterised protein [Yersinia frederiksenii]